ncbi:MAG TPA: RDD family protein [Terriglobales bacterium]|nr:RDD family protein [Terriglobales bacterium]
MSCPACGDPCHCLQSDALAKGSGRRSKFEADGSDHALASSVLIDPDAYDDSEAQFAASLNGSPRRFIPDQSKEMPVPRRETQPVCREQAGDVSREHTVAEKVPGPNTVLADEPVPDVVCPSGSSTAEAQTLGTVTLMSSEETSPFWKDEVAARLSSYRAKRKPKPPKYPSLQLKFEAAPIAAPLPGGAVESAQSGSNPTRAVRLTEATLPALEPEPALAEWPTAPAGGASSNARILEFPRLFCPEPAAPGDELAEPVWDGPRIIDVPEVAMSEPALGGIMLETEAASVSRVDLDVPLQLPPMWRRMLAAAVDFMIVLLSVALFGYIFLRISHTQPPWPQLLATTGAILGILWVGYEYLFLVRSGTTLGLLATRLHLRHFDGSLAGRPTRRWRVLAATLSGVSLGLGYMWCFLDEDGLCWHDRITRTYFASIEARAGSAERE